MPVAIILFKFVNKMTSVSSVIMSTTPSHVRGIPINDKLSPLAFTMSWIEPNISDRYFEMNKIFRFVFRCSRMPFPLPNRNVTIVPVIIVVKAIIIRDRLTRPTLNGSDGWIKGYVHRGFLMVNMWNYIGLASGEIWAKRTSNDV